MRNIRFINGKRTAVDVELYCTARQARMAMLEVPYQGGTLLDAVTNAIQSAPASIQIAWEYGTEWRRHDPNINAIASVLGLSGDQVDALFMRAMQL